MFIIFVSTVLGVYETFRVKIDDIETQFLDVGTNLMMIVGDRHVHRIRH